MHDPLTPLLAALAGCERPVTAFIRDDDAGWDDAKLFVLTGITQDAGVPIDLAAIPLAVGPALAKALVARIDAAPGLVGVHQHGCAHTNHETLERKCEFGTARDADRQRADIAGGRLLLQQGLGERLLPIFTPPWNRCAPYTPALLAELGFVALSRDRGALAQRQLPELPVDVDWSRHWREGGADAVVQALAEAVRARAADGRPLGLMLHHAAMADAEFSRLRGWLRVLARHARLRWQPMAALLADLPQPTAAPAAAA